MLSDEEKILTKKLRYCEQEYEQNGYLSVGKFEAIKEAVNLIEKQSKEIEDNKKYIDLHYVPYEQYVSITNGIDKKWKDKIKAKIEELEKGNKNTFIRGEKILVLQSLLEKEFPVTITKEELEKRWKE